MTTAISACGVTGWLHGGPVPLSDNDTTIVIGNRVSAGAAGAAARSAYRVIIQCCYAEKRDAA